jgi:hypothetical protein
MSSLAESEVEFEAEYTLESPVKCAHCSASLDAVRVVRLLRRRVNFTSSLPRRGYVVVCPSCQTVIPAIVG